MGATREVGHVSPLLPTQKSADHAIDYVIRTFRETNVADYQFAICIDETRSYCVSGKKCGEDEVRQTASATAQVGCFIRPLMAMVALELSQRGLLSLHSPIAEYFPELARLERGELVQVQHLISNTAGYAGFGRMPAAHAFSDRESTLAAIRGARQIFWPGLVYSYDNSGAILLGEILTAVCGSPVPDLVSEIIFSRLHCEGVPRTSGKAAAHKGNRSLFDTQLPLSGVVSLTESLMGSTTATPTCLSRFALQALQNPMTIIPRVPHSPASRLLPISYGLGLQGFQHGFFGYDTNTGFQANGFRFNPRQRIAIVLSTSGRYRSLRRSILSGLVDIFDEAGFPTNDVPVCPLGTCDPVFGDLSGEYFGNDLFHVSVRQNASDIQFTVHSFNGKRAQIRGLRLDHGQFRFDSRLPETEPAFFRDSRTNELCVMLGMIALKRLPSASGM